MMADLQTQLETLKAFLPDNTRITVVRIGADGSVTINMRTNDWQVGLTVTDLDQLDDQLIEAAWSEQTEHEAQQAIATAREEHGEAVRALSEQNRARVQAISNDHQARKKQAIDKAKADRKK